MNQDMLLTFRAILENQRVIMDMLASVCFDKAPTITYDDVDKYIDLTGKMIDLIDSAEER